MRISIVFLSSIQFLISFVGSRSSLCDEMINVNRAPIIIYYFEFCNSTESRPSFSHSLPFSRLDLHRHVSIDSIPNANLFDYLRILCSRDRSRVYTRTRAPYTTCGYIEHKFDDYNSNLDIGRSLYVLHSKQICVRHVRCVCAKANTHDRASYSTIPGTYMFTTTATDVRGKKERRNWRKRMVCLSTSRKDFISALITSENANLYKVTPCKRGTRNETDTKKINRNMVLYIFGPD